MVINRRMLFTIAFTLSAFCIGAKANPSLMPANVSTYDTTSASELNVMPTVAEASNLTPTQSQDAVFSVKYSSPDLAVSLGSGGTLGANSVMPGVPEPSTMLLLGTGLVGALRYRARRKKLNL